MHHCVSIDSIDTPKSNTHPLFIWLSYMHTVYNKVSSIMQTAMFVVAAVVSNWKTNKKICLGLPLTEMLFIWWRGGFQSKHCTLIKMHIGSTLKHWEDILLLRCKKKGAFVKDCLIIIYLFKKKIGVGTERQVFQLFRPYLWMFCF